MLSFGVGYLRFLEGNVFSAVLPVWLIIAAIKIAMTYYYFQVTKRPNKQFLVATIIAISGRLIFGLSFLLIVLAFQFFIEFYKVSNHKEVL